ncbi:MAG TPA: adenylate/guanylate cyclase domain-containing protein [Terriglobia bacterium]|jgi:adenylate cyclase
MPIKVLIVDDEQDWELLIRQRFRARIQSGEFEFIFARHGQDALEHLHRDPAIDVVMSDINMPVMDGLTLLSRLTALDRTLKAVVVSAYGDMQNIRAAMNLGAYDFLTKPVDLRDFELTLAKTVRELERVKQGLKAQDHLRATLEVVSDLSSELQLGPLLGKIIATITKMLNAERSTLFLHDEKRNELYTEVGEGLNLGEIRIPATAGIAGTVFTTSRPIRLMDTYADARFNAHVDRSTGFITRSILCVPVINKQGKTIGVTEVLNKIGSAFSADDEARLQTFSSQISIALENAKLFGDVQTMKNYNESILESMSSGVVTVNEDGIVMTCNAAGCCILDIQAADVIDRPVAEVFGNANDWVIEKLRHVEEARTDNVTIDAQLQFGERTIQANVTVLPLSSFNKGQSGSVIMIEDITKEKRLKATMSRYVDPSIAEKLLESKDNVLGGQSSLATVLFSDIRGFTRLTEELGPPETVTLLNEFFTVMVDCIQHEGGMLDKFIGDAFMAAFGIPLARDDDEDRAVRAAILMHAELRKFNERRVSSGRKPLFIGVGINTDVVVSGNIGSPKRMDYTVIGDGVNLASRLESACKEYGTGILVSAATFQRLRGGYCSREVDRVLLHGKSEPVRVFEILDYHTEQSFPQMQSVLICFADGLQLYRDRRWDEAKRAFSTALDLHPHDLTSAMYLRRCDELRQFPPAAGWNGTWVMKSK